MDVDAVLLVVNGDEIPCEVPSVDGMNGGEQLAGAVRMEIRLVVLDEAKGDLRVRNGDLLHDLCNGIPLGGVPFQEFPASWHVKEQVLDEDGRPVGAAAFLRFRGLCPGDLVACAVLVLPALGHDRDPCHGSHRRQCFPPEAEGQDGIQIGFLCDLAGSVTQECSGDILPCHTAAVIDDAHEGRTAAFDLDSDMPCAGINGIFDQLLNDRSRTFNDLAGSDQLRNRRVEDGNDRHGVAPFF